MDQLTALVAFAHMRLRLDIIENNPQLLRESILLPSRERRTRIKNVVSVVQAKRRLELSNYRRQFWCRRRRAAEMPDLMAQPTIVPARKVRKPIATARLTLIIGRHFPPVELHARIEKAARRRPLRSSEIVK